MFVKLEVTGRAHWSEAEHYRYCCHVNEESVSLPVFT